MGEGDGEPKDNEKLLTHGSDSKSAQKKKSRRLRKLLVLPYFLGIVWTCLHPIMSILTGEMKCRGWYLDEHALALDFVNTQYAENPMRANKRLNSLMNSAFLCDSLNTSTVPNLSCHHHANLPFEVVRLVPAASAVEPTEEAIVFVVPLPNRGRDWKASKFHRLLLDSLLRLADPIDTPWLAKTVFLVAPASPETTSNSTSLESTVTSFLDAYLGSKRHNLKAQQQLPPQLTGSMLRNMIVLDVQVANGTSTINSRNRNGGSRGRTDFQVLPQGRRGVLPNLDLVFVVGKLFEMATFCSNWRYPDSTFLVHPYTKQAKVVHEVLANTSILSDPKPDSFEGKVKRWAEEMTNLALFAYTLAIGDHPPHAEALDRGIDSVTIRIRFSGIYARDPIMELVQYLEYLIRALSNLHERLHHSITLYVMPSATTFVSHIEYFLPNLLLLVPLLIRLLLLLFCDMEQIHVPTAGWAIVAAFLGMIAMLLSSCATNIVNTWLTIPYGLLGSLWTRQLQDCNASDYVRILQTIQFVTCLTAIYIHVPLAFAHGSLGYPSALLWTPLIAFFNWSTRNKWLTRLGVIFVISTAPPLLVPRIFATYTTYIRYAYVPLHVQFAMLLMTRVIY